MDKEPDYEPTAADIENEEIDRQIEYFEEALRGEHGEDAQQHAEQEAARVRRARELREWFDEQHKLLAPVLKSPALVKSCLHDNRDYTLKLRSGEVVRYGGAKWHGNGWLTLLDVVIQDEMTEHKQLPFLVKNGVDVRLEEILWVMDEPNGPTE